jgi:hypothetical protein
MRSIEPRQLALVLGITLLAGTSFVALRPEEAQSFARRALRFSTDHQDFEGPAVPLECRLNLYEFVMNNDERSHKFMCTPFLSGGKEGGQSYYLELDDERTQDYLHRLHNDEDVILSLSEASVDEEDSKIVLSLDSEVSLVDPGTRRFLARRKLTKAKGQARALAIIIRMPGGRNEYDERSLYQLLYQDTVSLKNQYKRCSFGKFVVEPSNLGVITVDVNMYPDNRKIQRAVNAAMAPALEMIRNRGEGTYESLQDYADMILYILPEMDDWVAYATVGGTLIICRNLFHLILTHMFFFLYRFNFSLQ